MVTNDLAIAIALEAAESVRVLRTMVHGSAGRDILAGLSVEKDASTPDITQAETKKLMLSIATKMGRTSFACFAPLETIDTIVTDAIGPEDHTRLEESGIDVLVAG